MKIGVVLDIGTTNSLTELDVDRQHRLTVGLTTASAINLRSLKDSLSRLGIRSNPLVEEFLLVAIAAFAADTRIRRELGDDGWTREITLSIPVSNIHAWESVAHDLEKALRFLTGDIWTLRFRGSTHGLGLSAADKDLEAPTAPHVALFSGGLDSFVGALDLVATGSPIVLVGHYTDGSASTPQDEAYSQIRRAKGPEQYVNFIQSWIVAPRDVFEEGNDDRQRSRSLLFIALGVLVADALGSGRLVIPENGLISLNVPMTDLRIGSYTTRTTHPHFISTIENVVRNVGLAIELHNPYRFKTKGEMLAECSIQNGLAKAASVTMSCAHPTASRWSKKGAPAMQHCGRCTACLIRRAAFLCGIGEDPTPYTVQDLLARELRSDIVEGRDVRAVRLAARRVLENPDIAQLLILKPGPLREKYDEYASLYIRGMRELWQLLERAQTRGAY